MKHTFGVSMNAQELLEDAAKRGDMEDLKLAINDGGKPKANRYAALRNAAMFGHANIAKKLLDHTNAHGAGFNEAFLHSVSRQHPDITKEFLPYVNPSLGVIAGAFLGSMKTVKTFLGRGGNPLEYKSEALHQSARMGWDDIFDLLLPLSDPKAEQSRALISAAGHGHAGMVKKLLPISDTQTKNGAALYHAAAGGHAEIVELLLPHSKPKKAKSLALQEAAKNGHAACVELLLAGSNIDEAKKQLAIRRKHDAIALIDSLSQSSILLNRHKNGKSGNKRKNFV